MAATRLGIPAIERKRNAAGRADDRAIPLDGPLDAAGAGQHIGGALLAQIELLAVRQRDDGAALDQDDGERVSRNRIAEIRRSRMVPRIPSEATGVLIV